MSLSEGPTTDVTPHRPVIRPVRPITARSHPGSQLLPRTYPVFIGPTAHPRTTPVHKTGSGKSRERPAQIWRFAGATGVPASHPPRGSLPADLSLREARRDAPDGRPTGRIGAHQRSRRCCRRRGTRSRVRSLWLTNHVSRPPVGSGTPQSLCLRRGQARSEYSNLARGPVRQERIRTAPRRSTRPILVACPTTSATAHVVPFTTLSRRILSAGLRKATCIPLSVAVSGF